jgi:hypothetical protein
MMSYLLTYTSVHLALLGYAVGLLWVCCGRRRSWQGVVRALWTLGCGLFLVHVAAAFHYHYGWSHAIALRETARETARVTGVQSGSGLYLNYLFTVLWVVDVASWWLWPERYLRRSAAWDWGLHGFFLFLAFNATVVFEHGWVRWTALAVLFGVAAVSAFVRVRRGSSS